MATHTQRVRPHVLVPLVFFVFLIFSWILLFSMGSVMLDPDFGWHIRMGELIATSGIPRTDPFSYTMPSYPYVDHEWLLDFFSHRVYPALGIIGLSALFAGIAMFALVIVIPRFSYPYALIPAMLVLSVMLTRFAVRPQVVSWLYFALLINVFSIRFWKRLRIFLPLLFLLWANTHGSFALGLGFVMVYVAVGFFQRRAVDLIDVLVIGLSFLMTCITPYGSRMWWEVWVTVSDVHLRERIIEWFPGYTRPEFGSIATVAFIIIIFAKFRSQVTIRNRVLLGVSALLGVMSLRHVPFFVFLVVPLIAQWFAELHTSARKVVHGEKRFWIFYSILGVVSFVFLTIDISHTAGSGYINHEAHIYPYFAVQYMRNNPIEGNVFTRYGWGGYMIWKFPEKKVFIDGRMPSFRMHIADGEAFSAMDSYLQVLEGERVDEIFDTYTIRRVLLPVKSETDQFLMDFLYRVRLLKKQDTSLFQEIMMREPWYIVYQDNQAVVYQRD